jgi:o-succinylbenzoate---CoA ligase
MMPPARAAGLIRKLLADREPFAMPGTQVGGDVDLVLRTSGSTAAAKSVGHSFDAVQWAAAASRRVLGDKDWKWLLLMSPFATGGVMTLARSVPEPLVWPGIGGGFHPAEVTDWYPGGAEATSVVSTQLARLLATPAGVRLLRSMQVVLVGGGPFPTTLRRRCRNLGISAVATYGATETLGGCVYDGLPWPGVRVSIIGGQIHIDGPNLSSGYVPGPAIPRPWPTGDLGRWSDGRLQVRGRRDEQVPVKGVNRHLWEYEQQALSRPGVLEAVAVAVPDEVDGYRVVVFVEDGSHRLPRLQNGKPDRRELLRRASGQRR